MESEAAIIQGKADFSASFYVLVSALAVMTYDTILTLPQEIELLWRKKFRLAALLYSMARYGVLIFLIGFVISETAKLNIQYGPLHYSSITLHSMLVQSVYRAFTFSGRYSVCKSYWKPRLLILRTYAISKQSRWVLTILCLCLLGAIGSAIPSSVLDSCQTTPAQQKQQNLDFNISTSIGMATETAVIIITFYYTFGLARLTRGENKGSWISLLLKQGLLRYLFILTVTLTHVVCQATLRLSISGVLWPLENALSTLFICRFLLEIRERNKSSYGTSTQTVLSSLGSFHVATQRTKNIIMEEFGDPDFSKFSPEENSRDEVEFTTAPGQHAEDTGRDIGNSRNLGGNGEISGKDPMSA